MTRALSINSLLAKKYKTLDFQDEWYEAFDQPEQTGVWFIWGNSANGKTTFVLKLARQLAQFGRVAFVSLEEGACKTFQDAVKRIQFSPSEKRRINIVMESMDELDERLQKHKAPRFVIIDSIQYTGWNIKEFMEFKKKHPNKLLIIISQADGRKPAGRTAVSVQYDADLKIWIEGFRAFSKGRYIGPKGEYDIVPHLAAKHWGN